MDLDWVSCVGGHWVICLIDFLRLVFSFGVTDFFFFFFMG